MATQSPTDKSGVETYGEAHAIREGNFIWSSLGRITLKEGPEMVADELIRTLRTRQGEDPFRPEFGLDRRQFIGGRDAQSRDAIRDAIGPDADPRVASIDDITIDRPSNDRENSLVTVRLTLSDGTPVEFRAAFEALIQRPGGR